MSSTYSPAVLVARFLRANHYNDTLAAFLAEANLPPDAGDTTQDALTIEKVLHEKKIFDTTLASEKLGDGGAPGSWSDQVPNSFHRITLPQPSNLLHVSIETFGPASARYQLLAATTASRALHLLRIDADFTPFNPVSSFTSDAPILCIQELPYPNMTATALTTMSGKLVIYEHDSGTLISSRSDHTKYVPRLAIAPQRSPFAKVNLATAGWDGKIFLYRLPSPSMFQEPKLSDPIAELSLPTNPEAILFVRHPETDDLLLLVTRRDSTRIYYYSLSDPMNDDGFTLLGSQNLAPHSNAWIAFSPSSIALRPTDPTLLAVATSSIPHMKLMLVRLLFPPMPTSRPSSPSGLADHLSGIDLGANSGAPQTQAAQARGELEVANREEAAILLNVSTLAPQTPYSTPQVVWRPDGTGVWVNGDDGAVRGVETRTGKTVEVLKEGHEAGSKVRSLWAGYVASKKTEGEDRDGEGKVKEEDEEVLVSGGFDQRLLFWRREKEA